MNIVTFIGVVKKIVRKDSKTLMRVALPYPEIGVVVITENQLAKTCSKYLREGRKIAVSGSLAARSKGLCVKANSVDFLDSPKKRKARREDVEDDL